ncbi:hypothetical protein ACOMHN_007426 [Nucella lapillus]
MAKLENKVDNLTEQVDKINEKMNKMEEGDLPQGMREAVKKIAGPQKEDKGENEALMHEIANETSKKEMAEFPREKKMDKRKMRNQCKSYLEKSREHTNQQRFDAWENSSVVKRRMRHNKRRKMLVVPRRSDLFE